MKNHKNIKLPIRLATLAAGCLMLQACAGGETMLVGALIVHPATLAASTVAMPVAADSAAHTGLFDGLATPKAKQEEYAKLDQAAEELSELVGSKITRNDAKLLEEYQSILRQNFKLLLRWPVYEGRRGPLLHQTPPIAWKM